ncbi:hypothetical protein ACLOJK_024133, partial [Asimina triloba]
NLGSEIGPPVRPVVGRVLSRCLRLATMAPPATVPMAGHYKKGPFDRVDGGDEDD